MGLFAHDPATEGAVLDSVPRRMAWTRERGTRRLTFGFVGLLAVWFVWGKVQDHFLLARTWPAAVAEPDGLTVVGTLDGKGNYERNMFRIVNANKTSRVELTDYGWRWLFDGSNDLFSDKTADAIQRARQVNGLAGDAMLTAVLRAGVARLMGKTGIETNPSRNMTVVVPAQQGRLGHIIPAETTTLGKLLSQYSSPEKDAPGDDVEISGGGSGSGREVEHGVALSPDTVIHACPVVLNSHHFIGGLLEEHPATVFGGKTFTVHLDLNPEGRSRFFQWSHAHENENLVFVLNNSVVAAGRIQATMDVNTWEITNLRDEEGARALVKFVTSKH